MTRKVSPRTKEAPPEPSEYERFEELARKLVKVPKRDIDAERAKGNGKKSS